MHTTTQFTALLLALAISRLAVPAAETSAVPVPPPDQVLKTLKAGHPRLLATAQDFTSLRDRVKTDPKLKEWLVELRRQADRILRDPPSKYEIPDGLRLLSTSRRVLNRVQTLGLLYQLEGDKRYADRTWTELEAAANFQDWNPRHFLDTAEMTHAFAIGYDWLYAVWTEPQRATLRTAMVEKGIKLGLQIVEGNRGWARARHNWNQVCNGGIGMGALALADVEPELCGKLLSGALKSIQLPMAEYGPDGAWAEGPGYWTYATTYNVVFLAGLQTALGTDFGLTKIAGFSEAGTFPIYACGPTGVSFNYADAHEGRIRASAMYWLARQFARPEFAWNQVQMDSPQPLDFLWCDASLAKKPAAPPPLDKYYRNSEVVLMRSAWDSRDALFVGFKAGDNKANHSNLDLGSFVLDVLGSRWAADLGADNYNFPGYFGSQRWNYYRLRAEGHNTLVINPDLAPDQDPKAAAKITKFESKPDRVVAIADLTAAYAKHARKVQRGLAMLNRQQVLVQDEIQADKPAEIWWFLHTPAQIKLGDNARSATLSIGSARLLARILSPAPAAFQVMKAEPLPAAPHPEKQGENRKYQKLAIQFKDAKDLRLAVLLTPLRDGENASGAQPPLSPLASW